MRPIEVFILFIICGLVGWFIGKCFKGHVVLVKYDIIVNDDCDFEPISEEVQLQISQIMRDAGR